MEAELLSKLVALLGRRPAQSASLAELDVLVPDTARRQLVAIGGLRTWLGGFPALVCLSGDVVSLRPMVRPGAEASEADASPALAAGAEEPLSESLRMELQCSVVMRGLPFQADTADVLTFLGSMASQLEACAADAGGGSPCESIEIMTNKGGRPSGFACVRFEAPEAAAAACALLHKRVMTLAGDEGSGVRSRYVEVFRAYEMEALFLRSRAMGTARRSHQLTALKRRGSARRDGLAVAAERAHLVADLCSAASAKALAPSSVSPSELRGPTLWIHGLPATTSEQDVLALLAAYDLRDAVDDTARDPVNFVTEYGVPTLSKLAIVDMRSPADVAAATKLLNGHDSQLQAPRTPRRGARLCEKTRALRALISPDPRLSKAPRGCRTVAPLLPRAAGLEECAAAARPVS